MSEDRCVICGAIVPEGRMVCPDCETGKKVMMNRFYGLYTPLTFEPSLTKASCPACKRSFKDFVKVVRCKDCEWWSKQKDSLQGRCGLSGTYPTGNWYCANGKRKEETDEV